MHARNFTGTALIYFAKVQSTAASESEKGKDLAIVWSYSLLTEAL